MQDREVADPDRPIEGTNWILDGIRTGDAVSSVPAGVTASIRIADGQIAVNDGCNVGSGTVTVAADTLTFGPLMMSKRPCQVGTAGVESAVTTVLTGTRPLHDRGGRPDSRCRRLGPDLSRRSVVAPLEQ